MENSEKKRVGWIDVAKGIGIYAIWLGHMGSAAGITAQYVSYWHVPIFFFLSGYVEDYNKRFGWDAIIHKIRGLLLPFYFFSAQSLMVYVIGNDNVYNTKEWIKIILKGCIRNQFFAASLWFLSGLFSVEIIFYLIKKLFNDNKVLLLAVSVACFLIADIFLLVAGPKWVYNIDSALYYLLFYTLGYIVNPFICRIDKDSTVINVLGVLVCCYNVLMFARIDGLPQPGEASYAFYYGVGGVIRGITGIAAIVYLSMLFEKIPTLASFGKNSLYLCGLEYIWKSICQNFVFFFKVSNGYPFGIVIYVFLILYICNRFMVPVEKYLMNTVIARFSIMLSSLKTVIKKVRFSHDI